MKKHKCWEAGIGESKIITETTFGQGESFHRTFVKCEICGKESKKFGGYDWFKDKDLRSAQEDWNTNNKNLMEY